MAPSIIVNDGSDEKKNELENKKQQLPWEAPEKQGLYDPQYEHEACGVGFIVAIDGRRNHKVYFFT